VIERVYSNLILFINMFNLCIAFFLILSLILASSNAFLKNSIASLAVLTSNGYGIPSFPPIANE